MSFFPAYYPYTFVVKETFMGFYKYGNRDNWSKGKQNRFPGYLFDPDVTIEGDTGITQQWGREQNEKAVRQFNNKIRAWGRKLNSELQNSINGTIKEDKFLSRSLKEHYRHYGKRPAKGEEITSIGISFKEEGVFVHLGVGSGYNMLNGTRVISTKDNEWRRQPKEWFNPVVERLMPELQTLLTDYCEDLVINTMKIYIN